MEEADESVAELSEGDAGGNELQRESILDGSVWSGPVVDGLASVGALDSSGALVTSNPVMVDTDLYDQ